jgi:hypothetical protein
MLDKVKEFFSTAEPFVPTVISHFCPKDNFWGNHISWSEYSTLSFYGHKNVLKVNDVFAQKMNSNEYCVFQILKIGYSRDPSDMFFGNAKNLGYISDFPDLLAKYPQLKAG